MKKSTSKKSIKNVTAEENDDMAKKLRQMMVDMGCDIYTVKTTKRCANSPGYRSCSCEDYPFGCGCDA